MLINKISNSAIKNYVQNKPYCNITQPIVSVGPQKDQFVKDSSVSFKSSQGTDFYDNNALQFFNDTKNLKNMELICDEFANYLPKDAQILDAGCGSGRDSKYFISKGLDVTAIDGSKELCELASENIGQKVLNMDYTQLPPNPKYDGVWACAALVHSDGDELHQHIDSLADVMNDGGILYTSFKLGDKSIIDNNNRVQRYFNEQTLEKLFSDHTNLEIEKTWVTDDVRKRPDNDWINVILRKKSSAE